jgi:hypothetical protein
MVMGCWLLEWGEPVGATANWNMQTRANKLVDKQLVTRNF